MNLKTKRILALALAAMLTLSAATGCKKGGDKNSSSEDPSSDVSQSSSDSSSEDEKDRVSEYQVEVPKEDREEFDRLVKDVEEKRLDPDGKVIAYLNVPGTDIRDAVVQYNAEKDLAHFQTNGEAYFERKDIYGNYSFEGCFFMDYEDKVGSGSADDMPKNTIIYGHHLGNPQGVTNDPDGIKFGQLLRFREKDFAEANPYIYLTTEKGDLVYQVFAVSDAPTVTSPIEYNLVDYSDEDFIKLTKDLRRRSYYNYPDVTVEADDKIMILSTCVYDYGTYAENNKQRFLVVAKLVTGKYFEETANVTENTNRKLSPYDPNSSSEAA